MSRRRWALRLPVGRGGGGGRQATPGRSGLRRAGVGSFVIAWSLLVAACSDDPRGPGTVGLEVRGPVPLGAAVVEIIGVGVTGVVQPAVGWAELVPVAPVGSTPVHRLVVIQEEAGRLRVGLQVLDVAAPLPVAAVVEATDAVDRPLPNSAALEALLSR